MNLEQARELLTLLRCGLDMDATRTETNTALELTGDLPRCSMRERLKRDLYDDSGAFDADHACAVTPQKQPPFVISVEQCAATDDMAGLEP